MSDRIYKIEEWLGVNENPEGDAGLRPGEAAVMRNFKITNNNKLQKRPGTRNIANLLFDYALEVAEEPTVLLTETIESTAEFQVYPLVQITDDGLPSISGTPATVTYGNAEGHEGEYYRDDNGVIYMLGGCVYDSGIIGGVQQYRWNKWTCVVSSVPQYSYNTYTVDSGYLPAGSLSGFSWGYMAGAVANVGGPQRTVSPANPGTVYTTDGDSLVTMTYDAGGSYVVSRTDYTGVYYVTTYSKGPVLLGYAVGPEGAYPDNSWQSDGGTLFWYDGRVMNSTYTWEFFRLSIASESGPSPVRGIWSGRVGTAEVICAACDGRLRQLSEAGGEWTKTFVGYLNTDRRVYFFGFDSRLYMLNGSEYKVWDGTALHEVEGYRPLVRTGVPPEGGGTENEQVNLLSAGRRVRFSPDGSRATFQLPEKNLASVDYAKAVASGEPLAITSSDLLGGTVTLSAAPASGVSSIEIGYSAGSSGRAQIEAMTLAEYYNGENDNRVFLYGDGSNKTFYSGLDYNGRPTAEYFPELNVVHIGDANTPLYDLLRHYNDLLAFKDGSAYRIRYGQLTLVTGALTAAFYVETINKGIGGSGYGQARLVENHPRTLDGRSIYEWVATTTSGGITSDQRNARRISRKVETTLRELDLTTALTFYDKIGREYYVVGSGGAAVVQNTENGAWYVYRDFPAVCMIVYGDEVYYGTADGYIRHLSHACRHDCGAVIDCYWESGAESFGKNYVRKYTDELYVVPKQEDGASVGVALLTDNCSAPGTEQTVGPLEAGGRMKTHRIKIRAKGYTWLKLIFSSTSADTTVTILSAAIRVREAGRVR